MHDKKIIDYALVEGEGTEALMRRVQEYIPGTSRRGVRYGRRRFVQAMVLTRAKE